MPLKKTPQHSSILTTRQLPVSPGRADEVLSMSLETSFAIFFLAPKRASGSGGSYCPLPLKNPVKLQNGRQNDAIAFLHQTIGTMHTWFEGGGIWPALG